MHGENPVTSDRLPLEIERGITQRQSFLPQSRAVDGMTHAMVHEWGARNQCHPIAMQGLSKCFTQESQQG